MRVSRDGRLKDREGRRGQIESGSIGLKRRRNAPVKWAASVPLERGGETDRVRQMTGIGLGDPLRFAGVGVEPVAEIQALGRLRGKNGDHEGCGDSEGKDSERNGAKTEAKKRRRVVEAREERCSGGDEKSREEGDAGESPCTKGGIESEREWKKYKGSDKQRSDCGKRGGPGGFFGAKRIENAENRGARGRKKPKIAEAGSDAGGEDSYDRPPNPDARPGTGKAGTLGNLESDEDGDSDAERREGDFGGKRVSDPENGERPRMAKKELKQNAEEEGKQDHDRPEEKPPAESFRGHHAAAEKPCGFETDEDEREPAEKRGEARRPPENFSAEEIEIDSFARGKGIEIGVGEGEDERKGVVPVMLEGAEVDVVEIVERRVVVNDAADIGEICALHAGGFEDGEVSIVGQLLVDGVADGIRGRKRKSAGEKADDPLIGGAGLKHPTGAGSAARVDIDVGADVLGPGVLIGKNVSAEKARFFAVVDEKDDRVARLGKSFQSAGNFKDGGDACAVVGSAGTGGDGVVVAGEKDGSAGLAASETRDDVVDIGAVAGFVARKAGMNFRGVAVLREEGHDALADVVIGRAAGGMGRAVAENGLQDGTGAGTGKLIGGDGGGPGRGRLEAEPGKEQKRCQSSQGKKDAAGRRRASGLHTSSGSRHRRMGEERSQSKKDCACEAARINLRRAMKSDGSHGENRASLLRTRGWAQGCLQFGKGVTDWLLGFMSSNKKGAVNLNGERRRRAVLLRSADEECRGAKKPLREGLPEVVVAVAAGDIDANVEEGGKYSGSKKLLLRAVGDDFSGAHEDDAVDFRDDVRDVMGDEDDTDAGLSEFAHRLAQAMLSENIEAVGWLVENERARLVDESASNKNALSFAGRKFVDGTSGERSGAEAFEISESTLALIGRDAMMVENLRGAEKAGQNDVEAGGFGGAESHQIV